MRPTIQKSRCQPQQRLTFRGPHCLVVLPAPTQRVEVCRHDVTPEVCTAVILVSLVT